MKAGDEQIAQLKSEVKGLNVCLQKLEDKVADSDGKHRENNFILSEDGIPSPQDMKIALTRYVKFSSKN